MTSSLRLTLAVLALFFGAAIHFVDLFTTGYVNAWVEGGVKLGAAILSCATGFVVLQLLFPNILTCRALSEFEARHRQPPPAPPQCDECIRLATLPEGARQAPMDSVIRNPQPLQILLANTFLKEQRERRRLAENFHDSFMQLLALCLMKLSHERQAFKERRKSFTDIEKLLVQCLGYSRSFIGELSPTALLPDTLPIVLRRLADRMRDQGLIVTVHDGEDDLSVFNDVSMVIYQTVNELLCNVLKHAHTSSAVISLAGSCEGVLLVTVRDQGIGFDTGGLGDRCLEQRKFGLFSIREQLTAVGGELSIESAIGAGTLATVVIPLTPYRIQAPA